ncbi:DUF1385 domain-containing protein, partial [Priestia megaterium]|uniref:DUF1385 domain-containing protein n=1 Tax=Priestia megaterium TaxID=1404 RepID=UPI0012B7FB84
ENNTQLTLQPLQPQSPLHYPSPTTFILFTLLLPIFVYLLLPTHPLSLPILDPLPLIPLLLPLSFQLLHLTN